MIAAIIVTPFGSFATVPHGIPVFLV